MVNAEVAVVTAPVVVGVPEKGPWEVGPVGWREMTVLPTSVALGAEVAMAGTVESGPKVEARAVMEAAAELEADPDP